MTDERKELTPGQLKAAATREWIAALQGSDGTAFSEALGRIGELGDVANANAHLECVGAVAAFVTRPDLRVIDRLLVTNAIDVLVKLNDASAWSPLMAALKMGTDFVVRIAAAQALGAIDFSGAERITVGSDLATALAGCRNDVPKDREPLVRIAAAEAIGKGGYTLRAPELVQALDDDNPDVRKAAVISLGKLNSDKGNKKLVQMLTGKDEEIEMVRKVRLAIANVLGIVGGEREIHALETCSRECEEQVTAEAAQKSVREIKERLDVAKDPSKNGFVPGFGGGVGEFEKHLREAGAPHHRLSAKILFAGNRSNRAHAHHGRTIGGRGILRV